MLKTPTLDDTGLISIMKKKDSADIEIVPRTTKREGYTIVQQTLQTTGMAQFYEKYKEKTVMKKPHNIQHKKAVKHGDGICFLFLNIYLKLLINSK